MKIDQARTKGNLGYRIVDIINGKKYLFFIKQKQFSGGYIINISVDGEFDSSDYANNFETAVIYVMQNILNLKKINQDV